MWIQDAISLSIPWFLSSSSVGIWNLTQWITEQLKTVFDLSLVRMAVRHLSTQVIQLRTQTKPFQEHTECFGLDKTNLRVSWFVCAAEVAKIFCPSFFRINSRHAISVLSKAAHVSLLLVLSPEYTAVNIRRIEPNVIACCCHCCTAYWYLRVKHPEKTDTSILS